MKTHKSLFILGIIALMFIAFSGKAQAATFNQTSISLSVGQSSVIYASNVTTSLYVASNSNSGVATVSILMNNVNIYGNSAGSTTVTVCENSINACTPLYITVAGGTNYGNLSLSQTSLSLTTGQTATVTAYTNYGTSGSIYVSSNSNSNIATASVVGNTITIYGSSSGTTTLTICQSYNTGSCASIYVTVGGISNYGNLSLSQTSLSLTTGQTATVTAYNTYGTIYVSNNSSYGIATATVSGNTITIYGSSIGSTTMTVCQNYNTSCGTIYVTVGGGYGYGYNNNTGTGLNISNFNMSVGSSVTVSPSSNYNTGLYVSNNSNPNVASATTGSSYLNSGCATGYLYSVTTGQLCNNNVNTYSNYNYNSPYIPGCYAGSQYSVTTGQLCYGSGNNTGSGSVVITATSAGSDTITLCQNNGGTCNSINVTVSGYSTPTNSYYTMPYNNNNTSSSGIPVVYSTSSAD